MTVMSIKMNELQYKCSINHICNQNVPYIHTPFISFKGQMSLKKMSPLFGSFFLLLVKSLHVVKLITLI